MVDFRVLVPLICTISILIIIFLIVFRRVAMRRSHVHVRRVHPSSCVTATYTVPGCEGVHTRAAYPSPMPNLPQPIYYPPQQHQQPMPPYPQAFQPQTSYPVPPPANPYVHNQPPPSYSEAQYKA
ncbi:hypothetical protein M3Y99_01745100 [Aphelenchoides fujianensis]|nr:hypothetical protein M3Y99_01745100 [Aphelenchoides fujianensis]